MVTEFLKTLNNQAIALPILIDFVYFIGPTRFFRFQTLSGQYRKEQRHLDGSVTGTYGWVDPNGVLRLFDYISDAGGYRIEQTRLYKV